MSDEKSKKFAQFLFIFTILLIASLGLLYYKYNILKKELFSTQEKLGENIKLLEKERASLSNDLNIEKNKNTVFETQIKDIVGTVNTLDKLSKTDKELLQKYSLVYFLNEHYIPDNLATITPELVYEKDEIQKIHSKVLSPLEEMLKAAKADGNNIEIISAYRSFGEQTTLKNGYVLTYGSGANKFSADQGFSEHQLGTTLDFTTKEIGTTFTKFKETESYQWLLKNAHNYGFILSYPEKNQFYQFEPWHWRFVGKKLANRLYIEKEKFYDLDQRIIDNYLINIFE